MKITEDKLSQNVLEEYKNAENCPSCLEMLPAKAQECPACRVDLVNFKRLAQEKRIKETIGGLNHLSSHEVEEIVLGWKKVEGLYIDAELHDQFVNLCYRLKALPFAVKKYSERLEKNSFDETAEIMRRRAVVLVTETLQERLVYAKPEAATETQSYVMRYFNYVMALSLICGVFILFISAMTQNKLFFFGIGLFLCLSSVMTLLFLKRELAS